MKSFIIGMLVIVGAVIAGEQAQYKFDPEDACRTYLLLKFDERTANWVMGYPLLPDSMIIIPRVNISGDIPKLWTGTTTTYRWVSPDGQTACLFRFRDGCAESYYLYDKREGRDPTDPKPIEKIVQEDTARHKK